jgi:probable phosphoglycerate mutase
MLVANEQQSRIFLVRHGETEWNRLHRLQGQKNSPLTLIGKQQAQSVRDALQPYDLQAAYTSPLMRAVETARIILQERPIDATESDGLKEIMLGPWEGKTRQETRRSHPKQHHNFWYQQADFRLDGAETFAQLQTRVVGALLAIFEQNAGANILVVSHWIAIKTALAYFSSTPLSRLADLADPANGVFIQLVREQHGVRLKGQ